MTDFGFAKEIEEMTRMDGPLQSGPLARWQRKEQEAANSNRGILANSPSRNRSNTPGNSGGSNGSRTPKSPASGKSPARCSLEERVGALSMNSRSGKKVTKTPTSKAKTPGKQQDRFIPSRPATDMDYGYYAVNKRKDEENEGNDEDNDENSNKDYKMQLAEAMAVKDRKVLNFKGKAPVSDSMNSLSVLYSCSKSSSRKPGEATRHISKEPDRVLDAPQLLDDYYVNLLDWSTSNILSVALDQSVFLWNADTGTIAQLLELNETDDYVTSLSSVPESSVIAVGFSNGSVQLWDTEATKMLRSMTGHAARVGSLSWNQHILSSGSRTGAIHHHDVRIPQHQVAVLQNHNQEVCGLKWSPDGQYLASGANDNLLNIWGNQIGTQQPLYTFSEHQAAVKALAWCPWKPNMLASGGGTADRKIRLWNVQSGTCLGTHDTESQVCSILWSDQFKELVSGHGYAMHHIRIWKYPTMTKVADLMGHSARVLTMAMSPDGTTVASAAADETIRLWKCFAVDEKKKKSVQGRTTSIKNTSLSFGAGLR